MRESATILLLLAALLPCSGCRTFDPVDEDAMTAGHPPLDSTRSSSEAEPASSSASASTPEDSTSTPAKGARQAPAVDASANSRTNDDQSLRETVAELVAAGALDRAAEQQLTSDLAKTDPALRGQLTQLLRTSLAKRQPPPADATEKTAEPTPESSDERLARAARNRDRQKTRRPEAEQAAFQEPPADAVERPSPAEHVAPQAAAHDSHLLESNTSAAPPVERDASGVAAADTQPETPAAREAVPAGNWQANLDAAVEDLAGELGSNPETQEDIGRQAMLRMLYLVDGKRDLALRPIPGAPPAQQDFWSKQIYGLSSYLDAERNTNPGRRAAEAAVHLRDATNKLGELATLSVRNIAFCSEVKSYGIYKKLEHYDFTASQDLLVYAEVENFKSVHTEHGYHTALRASYEIVDTKGARVTEQEFPVTEEHCQNARRDFFVRYFVKLPAQIYGGKYTLHLYVVDENSQKMDQGSIEFTIKSKSN
jgi:hypothetical protein